MFGIKEITLAPHELLSEIEALVNGRIALGTGQVDPGTFTPLFATNGTFDTSALVSRFIL